MKKYIIINGAMGMGKSTVGKRVCEKLGRAAFIDGDFCLDIHPFVGNTETITMARDNILHMSKNYFNCSECDTVVLSWIMGEGMVNKIISRLSDVGFKIYSFVLTCSGETLAERWKQDTINNWRNDENLSIAINSISDFENRAGCVVVNTDGLSVDEVAEEVIKKLH